MQGTHNGYIQKRLQCGIQRFVSSLSFLSWDTDASRNPALGIAATVITALQPVSLVFGEIKKDQ